MNRLLLLLAALSFLVIACGDDTTDVGTDPGADADDGATTTAPDLPIGGPYPVADLAITYEHPDTGAVEYRVVCLGDTATLTGEVDGVSDRAACLALAESDVQQRLIEGAPGDQACTEIYGGPETATVIGTIDDQPVDTIVNRTNGCGIDEWDRLLADLLPAPRPFE